MKPVIACVHGDFGNGATSFGKLAAEIGDGYRLIPLDRPGFAPGAVLPARYTFEGDAEALLNQLSCTGVAAFHLVGHSYGGLVAIMMARKAPDRIKSLHLIEPPLLQLLETRDTQQMSRRVQELQAAHRDDDPDATTSAFFEMIGAGHVSERLRGSDEWEQLMSFAPRFARNESPGEFPVPCWEALEARLPIFLYSGGRSHPALQAITRELALSPRVRRHTHVAGAGHAVQMAGDDFRLPLLAAIDAVRD